MIKAFKMPVILLIFGLNLWRISYAQQQPPLQLFSNAPITNNLLANKQKAASFVKTKTGGKVLDVNLKTLDSGKEVFRVKFLIDGHIQFMNVASNSISN